MTPWQDELAGLTLEEILERQLKNRDWGKDTRRSISTLVDRRLAKLVSQMDYDQERKRLDGDAQEWRRRAIILNRRITEETHRTKQTAVVPD